MNLRFVEAFYWACKLRSVSRAAEKLFITQSALSARIAALEAEIGSALLDRRDKQFRLSNAGVRFLDYAQRLLELQAEIKNQLGTGALPNVSLRIGAIESVLHSWLIPVVQQLRSVYPHIALDLTVETSPLLTEQLRRGALDLVFAAMPAEGAGIASKALAVMPMAFVGNARIHRKRNYHLGDLAGMELLTFQRGSKPHVALLDLFKSHSAAPPRVHAISSISAMVSLVAGGFGIATLPLDVIGNIASPQPLRALPCTTALDSLPIYVSYYEDPTALATTSLINEVLQWVKAAGKIA